ncbi:MAG: hypothetical protein IJR86_00045 [Bacteroidaceae bacterium]|nr:hypothetical protein [Bacteroidaceae bacterium]
MNDDNLIPFSQRSKSEVREMNRRGGINSGAARREKKRLKDIIQAVGEMKPSDQLQKIMNEAGFGEVDSNFGAMTVRQFIKAIKTGDTRAAEWISKNLDEEKTPQNVKLSLADELKQIWDM